MVQTETVLVATTESGEHLRQEYPKAVRNMDSKADAELQAKDF
jgi:hypothetical protein